MSLTNKVAQFDVDSDLVNAWVHGGVNGTITTKKGEVIHSPAKLIADNEAEIQAIINVADAWANGPATGTGSIVVMGGAAIHTPAKIIADKEAEINLAAQNLLLLGASSGSSLVGYMPAGAGAVATDVQTVLREKFHSRSRGIQTSNTAAQNLATLNVGLADAVAVSSSPLYLDAGKYDTNNITLPVNGGLIGVDTPRQGQPGDWINGTAKTDAGSQLWTTDTNGATNLVTMQVGSQLKNVNFWYPNQTKTDVWENVIAYPTTIKVGQVAGVNADNAVVKNVSALNAYNFMDIGDGVNSVGRTIVEDVFVNAWNRGFLIQSRDGDLPYLNRCAVENIFTTDQTNRPVLHEHIQQFGQAFVLDYAQGANMTDCVALGYGYGLMVTDKTWAQITNCMFDYCSVPFTANGADRVMLNNCTFINNYKIGGPSCNVYGVIDGLSFSNCTFGDYYSAIKTGIYTHHTAGTVKVSNGEFKNKFPAVLNTDAGLVDISSSGVGYSDVVGQGISIDGGPRLKAGTQLPLASINPTSPAPLGWTFTTPANVTAITNGIQIQGVGNNTVNWRPGTVSAAENNIIFFGTQIYCLEFDYYVSGQAGSPRLDLIVLSDAFAVAADAFQLCNDASTHPSGLPEGETFHVALILPWGGDASQLQFNLPSQLSRTVHRITDVKISQVDLPRGFSGLEWFAGKTKLPLGYYNPQTGGKIWRFPEAPTAGTWSAEDRTIQYTPAVGQPKGWICTVGGSPGTWVSEGNL